MTGNQASTAGPETTVAEAAPIEAAPAPAPRRRVLIVEDNETARKQIQIFLEADPNLAVDTAANGSDALKALTERPYSVIVTDLKMPRIDGLQLLEEVQKRRLPADVIVTTGFGTIEQTVQAMRLGAVDFLTKPINLEHLRLVIQRALRERALEDEVAALREKLHVEFRFHHILSKSPRMRDIFELISHVAQTISTVLIFGETGTGKELVARAVHEASPRAANPFVAVNCAALPESLLESELFGHEKGAFTSAVGQRKGRFELAHGGTIFLDEIGEIPLSMQAKLLRVLQERRFERVGGAQTVEVDVRVIAATNRDLLRLCKEGKFREDLYYRLNVVKLDLPPLHERPEDIALLAAHFTQKFSRPGTPPKTISPEAMELLLQHRWPGNIRELENAIERAIVTSRDDVIRPENLPSEILKPTRPKLQLPVDLSRPLTDQLNELTASFEERYLRRALKRNRGHIGRTARLTGLSRRTITDKIALYQIDKTEFKKED
ncbi:MAG: sigma-54-dependent transcriptional regulator [Isosphaeraceae bacterium]